MILTIKKKKKEVIGEDKRTYLMNGIGELKQLWSPILYSAEQALPAESRMFLPPTGFMEGEGI